MAADGISPALAIRSSVGVELWSSSGPANPFTQNESFTRDESKFCRAIAFSPDGRFLAWANGSKVHIFTAGTWQIVCSLPRPKAYALQFSPRGNYLVTLELFTQNKHQPEGAPNLYVYRTETGDELFSTVQKKNSDWEPSWSNDESIFALMLGGEAFFYETNGPDGFTKSAIKFGGGRGGVLSICGHNATPHYAFYVPGTKGAPSICKIFKYPALQASQPISSKSFFQADRVEMMWNKRGTGMILMTSTDVDQTGASYYGKQALHFLNTKGDSFGIQLSKEGPIHAVSWNPKSNEFCVIYGYMPSKATFFNLKCDPTFEAGEAPRNSIYYNETGNIVLLAGFGNLRGNVEVWNVAEKKLITTLQAPDSTMLEWCPDGERFVTATTAPRLRMGNGFKVWHYSGALLHETLWPVGQELLEVIWQKYPDGTVKEKPISMEKVQGIQSSQPQVSKAVYVPPGARGGGVFISSRAPEERSAIPGLPIGYRTSQSQLKKKRQTVKKTGAPTTNNGLENGAGKPANHQPSLGAQNAENQSPNQIDGEQRQRRSRPSRTTRNNNPTGAATSPTTGDPEKDKRIKNIQRKLQDITKLKQRREKGENLEANQVSKINLETELTKELSSLKIVA